MLDSGIVPILTFEVYSYSAGSEKVFDCLLVSFLVVTPCQG